MSTHKAEASAMETAKNVRELLAEIELERAARNMAEYANKNLNAALDKQAEEIKRKNALLEQGAAKIDELRHERDNAVIEIKRGDVQYSDEYGRRIQAEQAHIRCIRERDQFKARVAELEQDLSIVRGDLATANRRDYEAKTATILDNFMTWGTGREKLQAQLQKAERKAAKANTELEACRKHATALAYVVEGHDTIASDCMCDMCSEARAALEYLKAGKAKG